MGYKRHPKKRNVDPSSREMIYNKSRETILKKAAELCDFDDTDVGLLMFSPTGELTSYANKGRVEDMFLRYIEQRDDFDGCALESRLNELNRLKYEAEEKMRFYKPDVSKIHSEAEAHYHQQFLTHALRKIEMLKMTKLLEEEASPPNRTCDGASTTSGFGSS
ncbi:putative Formin 3 [Hibiscus syriacus]|uniref:Formin 3 n=1 Tax=Hibiscus syriacus TaxID=106335 RepID=A0A6A2X0L2_HIBSY|nr:putative Formin 3 [Hibiscus syriacus]